MIYYWQVYKAFFNDKDGQGDGDGEDDDVVPAAAEYTPIAVEEELARLEAAGTAASAAASVVLPPMEDDQTEEERIRRLAAAEHEEELRKLTDGTTSPQQHKLEPSLHCSLSFRGVYRVSCHRACVR
jgi:hypothetical protein